MTHDKAIDLINTILKKSPTGYFSVIRHSYKDLYEYIFTFTSFLPSKSNITERIWYVLNNQTKHIQCASCGKYLDRHINVKDFNTSVFYCSSCVQKLQSTVDKVKATKLKNHGDPNFNNHKKTVNTVKAKYGVTNVFNTEQNIAKRKRQMLIEHGNENWNNSEKAKQTIAEKVEENPDFWKDRHLKSQMTKISNCHDKNWNNVEKAQKTCQAKYGVKCNCCTANAIANRKKTFVDICGNENLFASEYFNTVLKPKGAKTQKRKFFSKLVLQTNEVIPMFSIDEYVSNTDKFKVWKWHCKNCGNDFEDILNYNFAETHGQYARCLICHPYMSGTSEMEQKLFVFFKTICPDAVQNSRSIIPPFEIDMYSPSKQIAIEFDGLHYHSESSGKPYDYHLMKTTRCADQGIQLIHIFEDEWIEKQNLVESRLKNLCGVYDETVFARRCSVETISSIESKQFQDENHIQGSIHAKISLGLKYKGELISLMTFGKPRFNKKYEWELLRFCNKLGYHIPGAASKLLKHFERTYMPHSIISYADKRWSQGKVYDALGFTLDHESGPSYWYCKDQHRFSRVRFQKHKQKDLLECFDSTLTEKENMTNNRFEIIYDCGNLVYLKTYFIKD